MNVDLVYFYLIDFTWFFLGIWVLLLTTAAVVAFTEGPWSRILSLTDAMRSN